MSYPLSLCLQALWTSHALHFRSLIRTPLRRPPLNRGHHLGLDLRYRHGGLGWQGLSDGCQDTKCRPRLRVPSRSLLVRVSLVASLAAVTAMAVVIRLGTVVMALRGDGTMNMASGTTEAGNGGPEKLGTASS